MLMHFGYAYITSMIFHDLDQAHASHGAMPSCGPCRWEAKNMARNPWADQQKPLQKMGRETNNRWTMEFITL